jgi:monoamine oxidase
VDAVCSTNAGIEHFVADCAVITLPLGVLQQRAVTFVPEPVGILRAAALARVGNVRRIELIFSKRFWSQSDNPTDGVSFEEMSFLYSVHEILPTWWTQYPARNGCLTAWAGGPRARALEKMNPAQLAETACDALSRIFHLPHREIHSRLLECHSHNWQNDPLSLGAYSYLPVGALDAPGRMSEPVSNTLYFAGEHTDTTGHWGTVHAALRSGLRAAEQILGD